jgi:hypothetical protein
MQKGAGWAMTLRQAHPLRWTSHILVVVLLAGAAGAQTLPARGDGAARRQQTLDYYRGLTVDAYNRVGIRSPRWDADAQASLDALAIVLAWDFRPDGDEYDTILHAGKRLQDAGCSDPLVVFARARAYVYFNRRYEELMPLHLDASRRMVTSAYHPLIKCLVDLRTAWLRARDRSDIRVSRRDARRMVKPAMDLLPKALAGADIPDDVVLTLFSVISQTSHAVERDRSVLFDSALPVLEASASGKPTLLQTARAEFALDHAMDARRDTTSPAEQVALVIAERLHQAATAGEQAWQADHSNARAADAMMKIEAARGATPQVVQQWFARAVEADPFRLPTYLSRLRLLEPRGGGSVTPMIEFARTCRDHPDIDSGIPLLLVEAHLRAAQYGDAGELDDLDTAYFTSTPDVWRDIQSVYEPYLQRHPQSLYHRSRYAQLAAWCGQWPSSDKQLREMGDQFSMSWFRSRESWQSLRSRVQAQLAQ